MHLFLYFLDWMLQSHRIHGSRNFWLYLHNGSNIKWMAAANIEPDLFYILDEYIDHFTFIAFVLYLSDIWFACTNFTLSIRVRDVFAARGKFHLFQIHRYVATSMHISDMPVILPLLLLLCCCFLSWNVSSNLLFGWNSSEQHECHCFRFLERNAMRSKRQKWNSTGIFL